MRLIKGGNSLNTKLKRLAEKHDNIAFAVAWASSGSGAYQAILANRQKIRKAVIGTHFYQTHPDVLDDFVNFDRCHFVLQPQGVFHPKVFLFWSNNSWDLLIGSANLTKGALTKNTELLLHVTSKDTDVGLRSQAECMIFEYWDQGEVVTSSKAGKYRELWKTKQKALRRLSGTYIPGSKGKAPIETNIMPLPWVEFLRLVRADPYHGFSGRCELLSLVREYFDTHA
jgi:HKD family nuclease